MKEIQLSSKKYPGHFALVDDEDFDRVSQYKWHLLNSNSRLQYAHNKNQGRLHRFLLGLTDPKIEVDHKNGNGLDCRRENLRIATRQQQQQNRTVQSNCKSGFKGVSFFKRDGNFVAKINVNRKQIHIGYFSSAKEASVAYESKARELFGEFFRESKKS